jgi:ribosome-binding protein aMBF1 (putative translation factor)
VSRKKLTNYKIIFRHQNTAINGMCQPKKQGFLKKGCIMPIIMGRKSKLKLPVIELSEETIGKRIARLRKEKGKTQVELAKKMGLTQGLISDYELDKLRPYHEMIARFAVALDVSADELLGLTPSSSGGKPSLKLTQRMKK